MTGLRRILPPVYADGLSQPVGKCARAAQGNDLFLVISFSDFLTMDHNWHKYRVTCLENMDHYQKCSFF